MLECAQEVPITRHRARGSGWEDLPEGELLDVRLCDLGLTLRSSRLQPRLDQLDREFERAGLPFRPYRWLSSDWFTPDGHTGFAIPFFLAHPRLARLEHRHMFEVEGGSRTWCMQLLRHEAAHALDNAYRLRRRKRWRELFGSASTPYRAAYTPRPTSRRYVLNLDYWYAQSHPLEDFAETFAVWLAPASRWRTAYEGWPALEKLEYVDELMQEIRESPPALRTRACPDSLRQLRYTLREYYRRKRLRYRQQTPTDYETYMRRLFSEDPAYRRRESAASFLARHRRELRSRVSDVTGQHAYVVDQVLGEMITHCRDLGLRLTGPGRETRLNAVALLTALTMTFVRSRVGEYLR